MYLNRFYFSDTLLDPDQYISNIMGKEELSSLIDEIKINHKKEMAKKLDNTRANIALKQCKQIEMTNIETNEVLIFPSITAATIYLRELNPDYKSSAGTISDAIKNNRVARLQKNF